MSIAGPFPKITFGIIVLNGEPFTRYNLRALYPFAHEIIVVEGASPGAAPVATPDGHSTDGTLETLQLFKEREDPSDKVRVVTAEDEGHPDGFWPGEKHEQSQAYARRATGDYLWQVDIDEFYKPGDMSAVLQMLENDPDITAVSFKTITFWGGFDYIVDGWYLRRGAEIFHRLFRWNTEYQYVTHRPPTVHDAQGCDLRSLKWIDGYLLAESDIYLYHYALLFPKQVTEKCQYYRNAEWAQREKAEEWAENVFRDLRSPYQVHNVYDYPSWLERYESEHPPQIQALRRDLISGQVSNVEMRCNEDMDKLLESRRYRLGRAVLRSLATLDGRSNGFCSRWWHRVRRALRDPDRVIQRMKERIS